MRVPLVRDRVRWRRVWLTPLTLAPFLGVSGVTLRRWYRAAVERCRADLRELANDAQEQERDVALAAATVTDGEHVRWTPLQAEAVLRAYGKSVPKNWKRALAKAKERTRG